MGSEIGSTMGSYVGGRVSEGSKVGGRVSEGSKVGAKVVGISSEVSNIELVCSDSVVACSYSKVREIGSRTFECSAYEVMS